MDTNILEVIFLHKKRIRLRYSDEIRVNFHRLRNYIFSKSIILITVLKQFGQFQSLMEPFSCKT